MPVLTVPAYAKLNLTLDVVGKRPDGYHDMCMVMQSIGLEDELTIEAAPGSGITIHTNMSYLPGDGRNLAAVAAKRFFEATGESLNLSIDLRKRIPVCAGMGGGSSDAAAVLRALNQLAGADLSTDELAAIGERVGSDVPFCVLGGAALAEGKGERLTPLPPLPPCSIVVCKPPFSISTPELFGTLCLKKLRGRPDTPGVLAALEAGDLTGVARRLYNVFEDALSPRQARVVGEIKDTLIAEGALGACMSGTGPTVFGLFPSAVPAEAAARVLREEYRDVFVTGPV